MCENPRRPAVSDILRSGSNNHAPEKVTLFAPFWAGVQVFLLKLTHVWLSMSAVSARGADTFGGNPLLWWYVRHLEKKKLAIWKANPVKRKGHGTWNMLLVLLAVIFNSSQLSCQPIKNKGERLLSVVSNSECVECVIHAVSTASLHGFKL